MDKKIYEVNGVQVTEDYYRKYNLLYRPDGALSEDEIEKLEDNASKDDFQWGYNSAVRAIAKDYWLVRK